MARDSGARGGAETAEAMMGAAKALHELTGEIAAAAYRPCTEKPVTKQVVCEVFAGVLPGRFRSVPFGFGLTM